MAVFTVLAVALLFIAPLWVIAVISARHDVAAQPDSFGKAVLVTLMSPYRIWEMVFKKEFRFKLWEFLTIIIVLGGCTILALHLAGHAEKPLIILGSIYWGGMFAIWLFVQWWNMTVLG